MSLEPRLSILRQGGILSDENYWRVQEIIAFLVSEHGLALEEENAAMFITHLCAAFERISHGEQVKAIDPDVYEVMRKEPTFERARCISKEIGMRYPMLPEEELDYITLYLGVLLASEIDRRGGGSHENCGWGPDR